MLDWLYSLFVSFFTYVSSFFMSLFSSVKTVEEGQGQGQEQEQEVALDRPVETNGTNQMMEGGNFQSVLSVQPVELSEE